MIKKVIVPESDWVGSLNAVKEMTGDDALILSSELEGKIRSIAGGGSADINAFIDRSITSVESDTEVIGNNAFAYCQALTDVNIPNAKNLNWSCFQNCTALTSIDLPEALIISVSAFVSCKALATLNAPKVTTIESFAFRYTAVATLHLPKVTLIGAQCFQNCEALKYARIDAVVTLHNLTFGQSGLESLVLTNTSGISTLANTTAFSNTKISSGAGYIYVPRVLIEEYKVATNWSTYAEQFRAIEDYPSILNV